jgi:hypothetical protein
MLGEKKDGCREEKAECKKDVREDVEGRRRCLRKFGEEGGE